MPDKHKVIVVMPAYNAERTLERTWRDIPKDYVDEIILVDDRSKDKTVEAAKRIGIQVMRHEINKGYGGNQKTCYKIALEKGADIIIMVHPDYQYDPSVIPELILPLKNKEADIMLGSRMIHKRGALKGGMPVYKFISNIFLTTCENIVFGLRLSEYHTGLRAYRREFLESINFFSYSDGFVFDTEVIAEAVKKGFKIGEVPIPTRYLDDSSSISFRHSVEYGLRTLGVLGRFLAKNHKLNKKKM